MRELKRLPFIDKVVWITGASSGIGEAMSYRFSELGARLILSSRNKEKLDKVNSNLPRGAGSAVVIPVDLEHLDHLNEITDKAWLVYGHIDIFVSNAGVGVRAFVSETDFDIDRKVMNVNYFAPVVITKRLLPKFLEQGHGRFVVISSLSAKYGVPKLAPYSASKHALEGFFESLRTETFEQNIDINIVVPGIIKTRIMINAETGDGGKYGKMGKTYDHAYSAERAAIDIVEAVRRNKESVFVGGTEGITLLINRFSPWLMRRFIRNHPIKRMRQLRERLSFRRSAL